MCFISNTNICLRCVGEKIRSKWNLLDDLDVLGAWEWKIQYIHCVNTSVALAHVTLERISSIRMFFFFLVSLLAFTFLQSTDNLWY